MNPVPTSEHWRLEMVAMPVDQQPILRGYTVAGIRPRDAEMDIDFVLHGDSIPETRWANRAAPRAAVSIINQGRA